MFENPGKSEIDALLRRVNGIAILGLSETPGRPSYNIAHALKGAGPIDVVEVFRRPEHVAAIVEDCIRLGVPALWLQDGVVDETAAQKARDAGIFTVMNRCLFRDRSTLG